MCRYWPEAEVCWVYLVFMFSILVGLWPEPALASRGKTSNVFAEKIIMLGHGITIHSFYHI